MRPLHSRVNRLDSTGCLALPHATNSSRQLSRRHLSSLPLPYLPKRSHNVHIAHTSSQRLRIHCSSCSVADSSPLASPYRHPSPTSLAALKAALTIVACCSFTILISAATSTSPSSPSTLPFASLALTTSRLTAEGIRSAIRSAWAGLAAGCLHTLAGADHLAALTPLTIGRSHLKASLLGALWGFGHSTGQLILGLLMVVLKDRFDSLVPALSKWGGTTVGLTLLAIGALGVYESFFENEHNSNGSSGSNSVGGSEGFTTQGDGTLVANTSSSSSSSSSSAGGGGGEVKRTFGVATFATGIVYGLQPDALFVIVPALALPTKLAAAAYIIMFVIGTVAAMGAYTGVIGATSAAIKKKNSGLTKNLSGFASFVAIGIGLAVLGSGWGLNVPFFGGGH